MAVLLTDLEELAATLGGLASDDPRLERVAAAAENLVLAACDRLEGEEITDPAPAELIEAAVHVAAHLWKLPEAVGGIAGFTDLGEIRLPPDVLRQVRGLLWAYRQSYGVA